MEFIYSFFQVWFSILCVAFAGCKDDFDDSELRKEIADLDGRLTSLEKLMGADEHEHLVHADNRQRAATKRFQTSTSTCDYPKIILITLFTNTTKLWEL